MDLVGAGLSDEAISGTLKISIQEVRNRIEGLLTSNGLSSRTHLAVARASHVVIPDFT
jgi:DNA-binding NarL/FixJ family response regulator